MEAKKHSICLMLPDGEGRMQLVKVASFGGTAQIENNTLADHTKESSDMDSTSKKSPNQTKTEKKCTNCHVVKALTEFSKLQRMCRECMKIYNEWRKLNKEHIFKVKTELNQSRDDFFTKRLKLTRKTVSVVEEKPTNSI